jgi:hypothetical protein
MAVREPGTPRDPIRIGAPESVLLVLSRGR